jgi:hypothetical protein
MESVSSQSISKLLPAQKYAFLVKLWPDSNLTLRSFREQDYAWFFDFIEDSLEQFEQARESFAVQKPSEVIDLIPILNEKVTEPLSTVIQALPSKYHKYEEESRRRSLELLIRLWLTINVKSPSLAFGSVLPFEDPLEWSIGTSLEGIIADRFTSAKQSSDRKGQRRVDGTFTAANLISTCGLTLNWTDNLTDHLSIDPKRQTLTVYKHKICLINHINSTSGCPIRKDVLEEALDTLNLLFPFGDPRTEKLLRKEGHQSFYQLGLCERSRKLDLYMYSYWREELQDLLHAFRSPPRSWKQLATDRRNLMEWSAFWVTFMVAILTLISIPCNIIQATYSVKAYHAALPPSKSDPAF